MIRTKSTFANRKDKKKVPVRYNYPKTAEELAEGIKGIGVVLNGQRYTWSNVSYPVTSDQIMSHWHPKRPLWDKIKDWFSKVNN